MVFKLEYPAPLDLIILFWVMDLAPPDLYDGF
jgi:hypothetical protein